MDKNAAAQELKVKELAVDLQSWVAYDNLNRMQRVNEQVSPARCIVSCYAAGSALTLPDCR